MQDGGRVALVTLGCARNEVDSEELAGRLAADGWTLVEDPQAADAVLVNTCGFIEAAKKDSIDTLLELAGDHSGSGHVVAVGCLAQRYGSELAGSLPEADAVLGFDDYPEISGRLRAVLRGERLGSHAPRDRRRLLPLAPVERPAAVSPGSVPGHGSAIRRRLDSGPVAPLKLASGCDRRCTFCAIPLFRGALTSRQPADVLAEAGWLARSGVRELLLVSENSTAYGKDLGDLRLLESIVPQLATVAGIDRVRLSYLQPAEMRPELVTVVAGTPGVAAYFDLSFQHASPQVLRRMRRFGGTGPFLALIDAIRDAAPHAGIRTNVIAGFPGETEAEFAELESFLAAASLDAIGVFGYSDEEGTQAAAFDGKLPDEEIRARVERISALADDLVTARAAARIGQDVRVLVEGTDAAARTCSGRAGHQGPEDGATLVTGTRAAIGDLVTATVTATDGVDLIARASG